MATDARALSPVATLADTCNGWLKQVIKLATDASEAARHENDPAEATRKLLSALHDPDAIRFPALRRDVLRQFAGTPQFDAIRADLDTLEDDIERFKAAVPGGAGWPQPATGPTWGAAFGALAKSIRRFSDDWGALEGIDAGAAATGDDFPPLDKNEVAVLFLLSNRQPALCTLDDIEATGLSRETASNAVQSLIRNGLAHRPNGKNKGATVTDKGRRAVAKLRPVAVAS